MALPVTKVEIAFDSGFSTAEGSRTWTDVTAYVEGDEGIDITYGRADELTQPDPNTLRLTLDNRDGRFTPNKSTSPYYPNVVKGKPIRVTVTYNAVNYVRFTGYIDSWPLVWPDGSNAASTVSISATSRRARLGHTATLQYSPIRYAYAEPSWPQAYWPMDGTRITTGGEEVFIDATNLGTPVEVTESRLFVHADTTALQPVFDGSTPGPVDELTLLKFPKFTDAGLIGDLAHYVGAADACVVNTAGELTVELVARFMAPADDVVIVKMFEVRSAYGDQTIAGYFTNDGAATLGDVSFEMDYRDDSYSLLHYENSQATHGYHPDIYAAVNDGELHHFALTLESGGSLAKMYVDGVLLESLTMPSPYELTKVFTQVILGDDTYQASVWIGHVAVRDEALSGADIAGHAAGALTSDETIQERLQRLAGYMGVPAAEVEAADSVAINVGDQSQVDRAPIEVADELAASTAGVLYDDRDGHLVMVPRNARYNQSSVFTLNATTQEIEGDLEAVHDDRYLVNYITVTQAGTDGDLGYYLTLPASVAAYGYYNQDMQIVSSSFEEVIAAASNVMVRYGEPETRVSNVSVDLVNLSTSQRAAVLNADIGTLFNISNLPAQAPVDPMPLYLEGYTETISTTSHTWTANTTPGTWFTNVAILDNGTYDHLDSGITLAY